jgi:hypothetical protein
MHFLYYAGMAADRRTEQIGLALSEDGSRFRRVGDDGLIVARNRDIPWKNTRVCNPAVIGHGREFLMFYHGAQCDAAGRTVRHAIGLATSEDGIRWTDSDEPALRPEDLVERSETLDASEAAGVIEPCVLFADGRFRMWFISYRGSLQAGVLCYAVSPDGRKWTVTSRNVLTAAQFGAYRLHYPHVIPRPCGYDLWFSLRSVATGAFGIFRMRSDDGLHMHSLEQVLPQANSTDVTLRPRERLDLRVGGRRLPGAGTLNWLFSQVFDAGRGAWGYAHPHVTEQDGRATLYYQRYNVRGRTHWMDIGRAPLEADGTRPGTTVLRPARDAAAWDSFFVADPFVVQG